MSIVVRPTFLNAGFKERIYPSDRPITFLTKASIVFAMPDNRHMLKSSPFNAHWILFFYWIKYFKHWSLLSIQTLPYQTRYAIHKMHAHQPFESITKI